MKRFALLITLFALFSSHDMFLKMYTYFLEPNEDASIELYNGTFEQSDNIIDRDRMIDVSLVGNGMRTVVDTSQWTEYENTTILNFTAGDEGTWVAGVSTKARNIELAAKDFNDYLEHDGVLDMLDQRKQNNTLDSNAVERYSKHVKAIFQVGDQRSDDWKTVLDYPIEFVPLTNPYHLKIGDQLQVRLLRDNQPLANQLVYVGYVQHAHDHDHEGHSHQHDHGDEGAEGHDHDGSQLRTNDDGVVTMDIVNDGHWFLRTIHMTLVSEDGLTHESNWATLTFEVEHIHGVGGQGLTLLLLAVTGVILLLALFLWLKRRQ